MEARGNASLESCAAFPKYKLSLREAPSTGLLADVKTLRVGSHCPRKGEDTFGRIGGPDAVRREGLAYRIVQAVFPELSVRSRVFLVQYINEDDGSSETQPALFKETDGQLSRRTDLKR